MSADAVAIREQWDSEDRDFIVTHLRRLGLERDAFYPFGGTDPSAWVDQNIYMLRWEAANVSMHFDLVSTDRHGETSAEVAIYWSDPLDPIAYLRTRVTLSTLSATDRLAAAMEKRTPALKLDWRRMLDQARRWVMEQYRAGDPGLLLRDAPAMEAGDDLLTDPALLEADGGTLLFGDGGAGKSMTALALGASLQSGESVIRGVSVLAPRRVGYVDWEWSARRHRNRLQQLTGSDMPDIAYIRCSRPIHEERGRLRRFFRDHRINYPTVDSVGLACGGEPESAEVASRFVNVMNELAPAWLGVAHVTKAAAEKQPDKPFGSAYWHNSARRTWWARAISEPGASSMSVGLYNRKANDGPLSKPFALALEWADDRVTIKRQDVREVPELDAARSVPVRMRDLLGRRGRLALHEIADELGVSIDAVRKAAQRGPFVKLTSPDGIYRWGLEA